MTAKAQSQESPELSDHSSDDSGMLYEAIKQSFAVIEFDPNGTILDANDIFLHTLGYRLNEIKGKHHRSFVSAEEAGSLGYRRFWEDLASGQEQIREFKRITKSGSTIWIRAVYMPIKNQAGRVHKVIKLAQDSTKEHLREADMEGKLDAISKTQAVIEFDLDGTIITANDNFLATIGYTLKEIQGQNHSMFVDEIYRRSPEYRNFWDKMARGESDSGEFKRLARGGREIWIVGTYNPIFDINDKPCKVVKFATEVTKEKLKNADYEGQLAAIGKAQAVIEFNLDGTIITANANFLSVIGYSLEEIKGKHHSMFVDPAHRQSTEYKQFWDRLNRGEYDAAKYKRVGKNGKEVWIQASYNPILDLNGKPFKVVKYATDITEEVNRMNVVNELSEAANQLASAAAELSASANQMVSNSQQTTEQAIDAARSADEVSRGVSTVATNTEEMQASIKEIARNTNEVSKMSNATRSEAKATNNTIQKLGVSSQEVGNVIKVISSIAQQTNLLALNATIEAARAGEAGRGFAVVANEVKELSKQTAKATDEITRKIGAIQNDSSEAVKAIVSIGSSIEKLNVIAGSIAASVEEQSSTTAEVARVVRESNTGVQGIANNIKTVSAAASQTSSGANQILEAAMGLQDLALRLNKIVKRIQQK
jgi:methyl-accepting chemotaxis protein